MKQEFVIQSPTLAIPLTIRGIVADVAGRNPWDSVTVAVAYATVAGVRQLLELLNTLSTPPEFRWLFGLDDCLTQPGALRLCMSLPRSTLRVASFAGDNARFHPKIMLLSSAVAPANTALILGSANLTVSGMTRNGEAINIVTAESTGEAAALETAAEHVWGMGHELTSSRLRQYERAYRRLRSVKVVDARRETLPEETEVLSHDHAEVDPSLAAICWIEVGKNTALGRELEFKAEQALFFGLNPTGGAAQLRQFQVSDGSTIDLRLKYQENAMWRLQMNSEVPEVAVGLRPRAGAGLGRSPFAAVFTRLRRDNSFQLRFVRVTSSEYKTIRRHSRERGTLGRTSSREYGWY